jgi:hypothetical protein
MLPNCYDRVEMSGGDCLRDLRRLPSRNFRSIKCWSIFETERPSRFAKRLSAAMVRGWSAIDVFTFLKGSISTVKLRAAQSKAIIKCYRFAPKITA